MHFEFRLTLLPSWYLHHSLTTPHPTHNACLFQHPVLPTVLYPLLCTKCSLSRSDTMGERHCQSLLLPVKHWLLLQSSGHTPDKKTARLGRLIWNHGFREMTVCPRGAGGVGKQLHLPLQKREATAAADVLVDRARTRRYTSERLRGCS